MYETVKDKVYLFYLNYIHKPAHITYDEVTMKVVTVKNGLKDEYAAYIKQGHYVALGLAFTATVVTVGIFGEEGFFIAVGILSFSVYLIHDSIKKDMPKKEEEENKTKTEEDITINLEEVKNL